LHRCKRHEARKICKLPAENELIYTGNDWVTVLLDKLDEETKTKIMFIWWRAWHRRNNIIFDTGKASIAHSVCFMSNYVESLQAITNGASSSDIKGKGKVYIEKSRSKEKRSVPADQIWRRPDHGWIKINVDASFLKDTENGS
jgi:hypothetical protein